MSEFYTIETAMQKLEKMPLKAALEWALGWRSDDFGHDCSTLLEAESNALDYLGQRSLERIKELEEALGFYADVNRYQNVYRDPKSGDHMAIVCLDFFIVARKALEAK